MLTDLLRQQRGVTLIELVVFLVVVSIALTTIVMAMNSSLIRSVDPLLDMRALECAQAKLDEINARKFDRNSPTGGIPACGSGLEGAEPCAGIIPGTQFDNVGDYAGLVDTSDPHCRIAVSVSEAGADLGLPMEQARLITVRVSTEGGGSAVLSTYRSNF